MKLYQIATYKYAPCKNDTATETSLPSIYGNSKELCKILEQDASYHIRIDPTQNVVAFGDIDHCKTEDIFESFMEKLVETYELDSINEISFTKSIKHDVSEFSYHWSIPSIETNCYTLYDMMKKLKNEIENIDLSVYSSKFFRLPNQTNIDRPIQHIIIQGEMRDFLVHNIKKTNFISIIEKPEVEPEPEYVPDINVNVNYKLINELTDEFHDYDRWSKMGWLFKSIGYPFKEFVRLSRTSSKFKGAADCLMHWNKYKPSKVHECVLHSILKQKNPERYAELGLSYQYIKQPVENNIVITNIEQRYLIALDNQLLDDQNDVLTNKVNEFFASSNIKSFNIKSPYDTGKTKLLDKIFTKFDPKRILWLSHRKTLTNDIKGSFGEKFQFHDYQEKLYNSDRLIIQVESILKLKPPIFEGEVFNIPKYDVVIIDEIESVLAQFESTTFKGKSRDSFDFIVEIIKGSTNVISLDGDMSSRSYNFLQYFGESINIVNTIMFNKRNFTLNYNGDEVHDAIRRDMRQDKKVVLASMSSKECTKIRDWMKIEFPHKKVMMYTGSTDDKGKLDLLDVITNWTNADLLLYSPTIESGVNFDKEHFDKIYGVICGGSTSQRAFIQMLSRVRKIKCIDIVLLNISFNFKINTINTKNMYYQEEVKQSLIYLGVVNMTEVVKDGTITKVLSPYDINHVHNKIELLYKHHYYFLAYLKYLLEKKGHSFKNLDNMKKKTQIYETDIIDDGLLGVSDISRAEYKKLLYKQQMSEATADDKMQIKKHVFKMCIGVDILTNELIDNYDMGTIKHYISLIDSENIAKTSEARYKEDIKKVDMINALICDIGFKNMYDRETRIRADALTSELNNIVEKNNMFSNDKSSRILFNSRSIFNKYKSVKGFLGCVNTLFEPYSLIIVAKQGNKKIDGKRLYEYSLRNVNGREYIDELLQYRINKGLSLRDSRCVRNYKMTEQYASLQTETKCQDEFIDDDDEMVIHVKPNYRNIEDE